MSIIQKILHAGEGRRLKAVEAIVPEINALEPEVERLTDDELRARTDEFREQVDQARAAGRDTEHGEELVADLLHDLLPEAFATVREAGRRVLGQRHFDVQLMGGAALHLGWVAEMKTGEGKTLVATLPSYLNALAGRGVHLITVNDYLATRDADWMGQLHRFLGLSVGTIVPDDSTPDEKRAQYDCDITYGTNNEFGFDYLRDNMVTSIEDQVQRGASTRPVAALLRDRRRGRLDPHRRGAHAAHHLGPRGRRGRALLPVRAHRARACSATATTRSTRPSARSFPPKRASPASRRRSASRTSTSTSTRTTCTRSSRRCAPRSCSSATSTTSCRTAKCTSSTSSPAGSSKAAGGAKGLHQAVEAKEGVHIKEENQTLATVTLQNYFRMYKKLSGMTGTANTEAGEFAHTYDLQVVSIPTNRPMVRIDNADFIYKTEDAKYAAANEDIAERHEKGSRCSSARSRSRSRRSCRACSRSGASRTRC